MDQNLSKKFFLISFLPALAYVYLEENYPVRIAITGGLILAVIEMAAEYFFTKHVHTISKVNFFLILFLGGLSLLGEDGIWFRLQPAFTGVGIGGFFLIKRRFGKGIMLEMMEGFPAEKRAPDWIISLIEGHFSVFMILYGLFMVFVAFKLSNEQWLFFKTLGFYLVSAVFLVFEMIYIRFKIKRLQENEMKAQILKKF